MVIFVVHTPDFCKINSEDFGGPVVAQLHDWL
jgi:hypothetical protein